MQQNKFASLTLLRKIKSSGATRSQSRTINVAYSPSPSV